MSAVTNPQWLASLAAAVNDLAAGSITESQFVTALTADTDGWIGITASDQVLAQRIADLVGSVTLRDQDFDEWISGTPTGGPSGDGEYPLRTLAGGTVILPSPSKLLSLVTHGADAKTGLSFSVIGPFNSAELLQIIAPPGPLILDPSQVSGWCRVAPTADTTFSIRKNGNAWGTVTFAAGSNNSVSASFLNNNIGRGDGAALYAPSPVDATLADFSITLSGI